jgi:hypothetical protein
LVKAKLEEAKMGAAIVNKCIKFLKVALCKVEPGFFRLATTYEPNGIVRERVFCYELYHQVRLTMGQDRTLSLNGEIDKRGHSKFAPEDQKNPDFVFHIPGEFETNTLIVEVKGRLDGPDDIEKDFETILTFVRKYQYKAGVFILYNHSFAEFQQEMGNRLEDLCKQSKADAVFILSIKEPQGKCEEHLLSKLHQNTSGG